MALPRLPLACVVAGVAFLLGGHARGEGPSIEVRLLDGSRARGPLRVLRFEAGAAGELSIDAQGVGRAIPIDQVVSFERAEGDAAALPEVLPAAPQLLLPGRDVLLGEVRTLAGDSFEVAPSLEGVAPLIVPLDAPLGFVLRPSAEREARFALLNALRDPKREGESVWLTNGDRRAGELEALDADRLRLAGAGAAVDLPRASVAAVGLDPALVRDRKRSGSYLEVALVDGSRLSADACRLDGDRINMKTRFGAELSVPSSAFSRVTVLGGSVAYLADREPAAAQYVPYLDRHPRTYGRDRTWDGQSLRLGGATRDRGLGTLPRTLLAYRIEPGDHRFQATVGLDERCGPLASATFRVLVDRKELFSSPVMSANDAPREIDVDLTGGRLLILTMEFGERGDVQDSGVWAEARVIRDAGPATAERNP